MYVQDIVLQLKTDLFWRVIEEIKGEVCALICYILKLKKKKQNP